MLSRIEQGHVYNLDPEIVAFNDICKCVLIDKVELFIGFLVTVTPRPQLIPISGSFTIDRCIEYHVPRGRGYVSSSRSYR